MRSSLLTVICCCACASAYNWPNPKLEALDSARWNQDGHNPDTGGGLAGLVGFVSPCNAFLLGPKAGRSNAADWIRTVYHDMATHNIEDGTGGLDASLRFKEEQGRPENAGDGFKNTFPFIAGAFVRHISLSDAVSIAAIIAIEQCGGPEIPFRGGRVDADSPNLPGVPQPQEDINSHISSFARQGFNQTEMIGLVACGHSFGGVQHVAFPEIVPDLQDPNNTQGNIPFDTTSVTFDNNVATEYISGTTQNPLVVGTNITTNSDGRIFSSDNNATMSAFAQAPELFASTCATLFAKMLDTVPRDVTLTEVIQPLPAKPHRLGLQRAEDGSLQLQGEVRLFDLKENPNRTVRFIWTDRDGASSSALMSHTPDQVSTTRAGKRTAVWYSIAGPNSAPFITLDATKSITAMAFEIDEGDGTPPRLEDQDGRRFVLQDTIMYASGSCWTKDKDEKDFFKIAVRKDASATRVWMESNEVDPTLKPHVVSWDAIPPDSPITANDDPYEIWTAVNTLPANSGKLFWILAEVNGETIEASRPFRFDALKPCPTS